VCGLFLWVHAKEEILGAPGKKKGVVEGGLAIEPCSERCISVCVCVYVQVPILQFNFETSAAHIWTPFTCEEVYTRANKLCKKWQVAFDNLRTKPGACVSVQFGYVLDFAGDA
jgi:hypothetical protein